MWNGLGDWMHGGGWGSGLLLWVVLAAVLVLAIRGTFWRSGGRTADDAERRETALEILKRRYARGDDPARLRQVFANLSKEEFEQKRHDLS